jgi:arylsulfatase A-like enzyme
LALVLVILCACGGSDAPPPDLVLIVLDTARVDRTSVYGGSEPTTPYLEEFARQGTRFDRAYSTSCWTLPAHASMFTGQLPDVHGADQLRERVNDGLPLLAQHLAEAGYQTAGFTRNPWISMRSGLARGFEHFAEAWPGGPLEGAFGDANPAEQSLRRWLVHERDRDRPAFVFVNLIRPHMPYYPRWEDARPFFADRETWQAALERYSSGGPRALFERHYAGLEPLDATEWQRVGALYDGELRQVDTLVRRMLADLERNAAGREQLVLIVSDHGENLGDHGHSSHMFDLGEPLTRVLLLARGPGFEPGAVDDRLAQLTDVYPTLLAAAGVEVSPGPGQDLRDDPDPDRLLLARVAFPRRWLANFTPGIVESGVLAAHERALWAAWDGRYKLVVGSDGSESLYDLEADPQELRPLAPEALPRAVLERLRARVAASLAIDDGLSSGADSDAGAGEMDPATLEALRSLGYVR